MSKILLCSVVLTVCSLFIGKCFPLLAVTENHPEVQAKVLTAVEEAKQMSRIPISLYCEILEKHIKEVCKLKYKRHSSSDDYTSFYTFTQQNTSTIITI